MPFLNERKDSNTRLAANVSTNSLEYDLVFLKNFTKAYFYSRGTLFIFSINRQNSCHFIGLLVCSLESRFFPIPTQLYASSSQQKNNKMYLKVPNASSFHILKNHLVESVASAGRELLAFFQFYHLSNNHICRQFDK